MDSQTNRPLTASRHAPAFYSPESLTAGAEGNEDHQATCPDCGCHQVQELPLALGIDDVFFDGAGVLRCCIPLGESGRSTSRGIAGSG